MSHPRSLVLFKYDWDIEGFNACAARYPHDSAGFDLFSFPSNARLAGFDLGRFVDRLAARVPRRGWQAVTSSHEQFGALAAALLAERMGWPGTAVEAVLRCQHKLLAREALARACPDANVAFARLEAAYGDPAPQGLRYPVFVKPVKAAFSVLARQVAERADLQHHTRFGPWELWVIRRLVEPFERVLRSRLPAAPSSHSMMVEEPICGQQYNMDGFVLDGTVHALGVVDAVMYPGTHSFMRFEYPGRLPAAARERALDVARRFLGEIGFTHGMFNMEFFHDEASGRLTVIEFNPRLASQFGDLYYRTDGIDMHAMSLALAHGRDPVAEPRVAPGAGIAASFVYRTFSGGRPPRMPGRARKAELAARFPDALLLEFPKSRAQIERDFKWLGSYRHGILHLGGRDQADLRRRCEEASRLLGWTPPYGDYHSRTPVIEPSGRQAVI